MYFQDRITVLSGQRSNRRIKHRHLIPFTSYIGLQSHTDEEWKRLTMFKHLSQTGSQQVNVPFKWGPGFLCGDDREGQQSMQHSANQAFEAEWADRSCFFLKDTKQPVDSLQKGFQTSVWPREGIKKFIVIWLNKTTFPHTQFIINTSPVKNSDSYLNLCWWFLWSCGSHWPFGIKGWKEAEKYEATLNETLRSSEEFSQRQRFAS